MEAFNIHPSRTPESVAVEALVSIAVSLKRIADMMESEYPPRAPTVAATDNEGGER